MSSAEQDSTGSPPRRRNARGDGQRLRGEILAAAAAILDETGDEHAVTLRAVARRVGIAAPSIYSHFDAPQAILSALVTDEFDVLRNHLVESRDAAGSDPGDRLEAVCTAYLDHAAAHPQLYRLMFGGTRDTSTAMDSEAVSGPVAAELSQDVLKVVADGLEAAAQDGCSSSDDPAADAVAIWLAMHGLAMQRAVSHSFPFPDDIFARLVRPLLRLTH